MSKSLNKLAHLFYGYNSNKHLYHFIRVTIKVADQCTDLGVLRSSDFKYKHHINAICLKASRLAAIKPRAFRTRDWAFLIQMFVVFLRQVLEYASHDWDPREVSVSGASHNT